jgi:hypothetical protein
VKYRVLDTADSESWCCLLNRLPEGDIYFLPEYHRAYELNGDGTPHAYVAEENDGLLFYPFMVRPIERIGSEPLGERWYDIETVYGYSGPLCTTTDPSFLARAWEPFSTWCEEKRIVAEFIRFNPLVGNQRYVNSACSVAADRETVSLRLDCSEEELWNGYPSIQRNMVRKALKRGLICVEKPIVEGLSAFRLLYDETMRRVEASHYYLFSDAYFSHLCTALRDKVKLFAVLDGGRTAAAALFFLHNDRIHYHLAGSDARYSMYGPNNALIHGVALWGLRNGLRYFHLGGGRTPSPSDSLFRFKASISRLRFPFYIGKRIHDREVYDRLCAVWMQQAKVVTRPNYFLLYRLEGTT